MNGRIATLPKSDEREGDVNRKRKDVKLGECDESFVAGRCHALI
jgi:hypothetical protein